MSAKAPENPALPKKRPRQARAKFTVQVLYDTFVRIWRRDGPDAATMRAVAEESGFAIGTIYDYFPSREALLSGYVRHVIEGIVAGIEADQAVSASLPWPERLSRMILITSCAGPDAPYFDRTMMLMEADIAEHHHHRRAFDDLAGAWGAAIRGWPDLKPTPPDERIRQLFGIFWGARRYMLLVEPDNMGDWLGTLEETCQAFLGRVR